MSSDDPTCQWHPVGSGWPEIAASDPDDPARWWRQLEPGEPSVDWLPLTSIGAEMGVEHFVLDVNGARGEHALAVLIRHYNEALPATFEYRSGDGSRHFIMLIPRGIKVRSSESELAPGLNIRGEGYCAVLPPSITAEGRYVMIADAAPALPPRWLAQWLREQQRKRTERIKMAGRDGGQHQAPQHPDPAGSRPDQLSMDAMERTILAPKPGWVRRPWGSRSRPEEGGR